MHIYNINIFVHLCTYPTLFTFQTPNVIIHKEYSFPVDISSCIFIHYTHKVFIFNICPFVYTYSYLHFPDSLNNIIPCASRILISYK